MAGQALALFVVVATTVCLLARQCAGWLGTDAGEPSALAGQLLGVTVRAGGMIGAALVLAGVVDWVIQRWCWYRRQMMTDEELREESRQDEAPRRGLRRQIAGTRPLDGINSVNADS
jgi:flagellar biosynthesis protein FlhB